MATRTKNGGSAVQYEDFQAKSEWKEEEDYTLFVHLPDFQKKKLKVTYLHSTNSLRVVAERPLADNKWSRFDQAFPVPENCDVKKIRASFQKGGVLVVTMPKTTITTAVVLKEPKPIQEAPSPPKVAPPSIGKEPKAQKDVEDTAAAQKQTGDKKMEASSPPEVSKGPKLPKGQDNGPPKAVSDTGAMKPKEEDLFRKDRSEANEVATEPVKERTTGAKEPMITKGEETGRKRKDAMITDDTDKVGDGELKPKKDLIGEKMNRVKNVAAKTKQAVMQGFPLELSDERKALVNICVAVLVIVALGAYVSYRYRSANN